MLSEGQHRSDMHLSDQEMLLAADGELSTRRAAQVHAHITACWNCRARMAEIEGTIANFARAHRQTLDPQLPPIAGPRALLRAQLAELASKHEASSWRWLFQFAPAMRAAAFICIALFVAGLVGKTILERSTLRGAEPDRSLTPGATRRVAITDVCSMPHEEVVAEVSTSLRQEVFQKYGLANAHPGDYEIDYLIAPGLGGVEDIHNLWPEPYTVRTWNAHVKDALEEHLHQMVCSGNSIFPPHSATSRLTGLQRTRSISIRTDLSLYIRASNQWTSSDLVVLTAGRVKRRNEKLSDFAARMLISRGVEVRRQPARSCTLLMIELIRATILKSRV